MPFQSNKNRYEMRLAEAERRIETVRGVNSEELDLSYLDLPEIPKSLWQLSHIKKLNLSHNGLGELSSSLSNLQELQELDISDNHISALPDSICELSRLRILVAYNNRISELPDCIDQMGQLEQISIFHNQLNALPESLGKLGQLRELIIFSNLLTTLPESIGQLAQLRKLDARNNKLSTLPESLLALAEAARLRELYLHSNDSLGIPPEILGPRISKVQIFEVAADPRAILRYFFAQRRTGGVRTLNEAKVLFVGEAEVGKSSLIAALQAGPVERHFDKTRGIVREKWWPQGENEGELRLNLWDFGGQEVYHATHTFFLTQRAVYIVVVDARANDGQNNVEYWLQMARSFGGDAPVLVVVNKCDQHGDGPDENLLKRKYGHDLQFIRASCWTGEGLDTLKEAILSRIGAMSEVRREMPVSWLKIKDELERMTAETLPLHAYRELCTRHGESDEKNQELLLDLWHKLGTVLYFCDKEGVAMSDQGILNPEWVTKGVYAVLDDEALRQRNGLMTRRQLSDTLGAADYRDRSPQFIEDMMRQFELLYDAPDHSPRTMLVPRLLDEKEPPLAWPETGTIRFLYRYEVLPSGLLPRFIVRRHQEQSQTPGPWRHGCVLEINGCRALVRADGEKKEVEINVSGPAAKQREALDKVRLTFDDIHGQFKDLPVEEFIPVPGHPNAPLLRYSHLRNLEWEGKFDILPAEGSKPGEIIPVLVSDALGSVRSEARKEREQQQAGIYVAGDLIQGDKMSDGIHIGGDASGPVTTGGITINGDGNVIGNNNQVSIQKLADNPAELKAEIEKLRALIEQARAAGANKYVCDAAAGNVKQLEEAVSEPDAEESKEKAGGALAMLEGAAKGFESYEKIGTAFQGILKIVGPALALLLKTQLPF